MADVFDEPTLSGFNLNPPSDGGAQTEENTVEWAKHISKIGTPLQNYSDSIKSNITTAFAKTPLLGGVKAVATTYTLLASDQGKVLNCTSTFTLTLLTAATAGSQFVVMIVNTGTGVITVDGAGSETINGETTYALQPQDSVLITSDGSNWVGIRTLGNYSFSGLANNDAVVYNSANGQWENAPLNTLTATFVDEATGTPNISTTTFDVATNVTKTTWESVGPTGGGKTNTWTALDSVAASADWIEVKIRHISSSTSDTTDTQRASQVYVRENGSSAAQNSITEISYAGAYTTSTGGNAVASGGTHPHKIPVSSRSFDVTWNSTFVTGDTIELYLVGYGFNT